MKKILLLGLFLTVFLIFPKETFATNCCSGSWFSYVDYGPNLKGCCHTALGDCSWSPLHFDSNQYQCGINACDVGTQQCTTTAQTKAPSCPNGYTDNINFQSLAGCTAEQKADYCCKMTNFDPTATCNLNSNWNGIDPASCSNVDLALKNNCGGTFWKYNTSTKKCEKYVETLWDLKKTTCKDMSTNQDIVGFATAIGCVPTGDLQAFLKFVLVYAFVASGGIILLLIISTGYTLITSSGNPEKLQGAQENIVALFSGLALIAFSLVLLQTIGADILNLKAFMP